MVEVDVDPAEPGELAAAHPGGGDQQPRGVKTVVADVCQERAQLLGRPDLLFGGAGGWGSAASATLLLARAFGIGRLTPPRVLGLALGLAGVVLLAASWHDGSRAVSLAGVLAALGAAACYAGSYVYAWLLLTNRGMEPLVLAAAQLTLGAILLGAAVPWIGRQSITLSSNVVLSVIALGVLSTGVAYVMNYRLIQDEGPTVASMTNYLTPVVAVLLGIAFVDERLSWNLIVGTAVILAGLWIAEHYSDEPRRPVTR